MSFALIEVADTMKQVGIELTDNSWDIESTGNRRNRINGK
jgi:hypothetical protein